MVFAIIIIVYISVYIHLSKHLISGQSSSMVANELVSWKCEQLLSCLIRLKLPPYCIRGIFHETIISTLKNLRDFNLTKSALQ